MKDERSTNRELEMNLQKSNEVIIQLRAQIDNHVARVTQLQSQINALTARINYYEDPDSLPSSDSLTWRHQKGEYDQPESKRTEYYTIPSSLEIPEPDDSFTERQLYERFNVRNSGGIRPSNKNKVIILIDSIFTVNIGQGNYQDEVDEEDGIVHYIGEGNGDQQMIRNNRSILESKNRGFRLLYFEKPRQNHVVFKFEVEYDSHIYLTQENSEGRSRKVIQFKLRII